MEEKSWRNHADGIVEGICRQRHPGGTQPVFRRSPGDNRRLPRQARGAQRHPAGTQRHPEGSHGTRGFFDAKCSKTIMFYSKNDVSDHFCVDWSDLTLTKSTGHAQK